MVDVPSSPNHSSIRRRIALIVERKLVRNRGHYHTQISAIEELLSDHDIKILAGADYDGFLPYPASSITVAVSKEGRRARRDAHGPLIRRLTSRLKRILSERQRRHSNYGIELSRVVANLGLKAEDTIVIPTATLDDLSAIVETYEHLDSAAYPQCHIRFLDPHLGEPSLHLRDAEMAALLAELPQEIRLYCETEEMANFMSERFRHSFTGGFYLPCTLDPRLSWPKMHKNPDDPFRVGVFGMPRKEKGSARIRNIIKLVGELQRAINIEFAIQGNEEDFLPGGLYQAPEIVSNHVAVRRLVGALEPEEFQRNLLSCDVILLPYDTPPYNLQGSGLVQDAVAANIPVIFSRGMSMQRFLDCGNALPASSDTDFSDAILALASGNRALETGCAVANRVFCEILANHPISRPMQ